MRAYILVSRKDPADSEWCSLDGALAHLCAVESYPRLESKADNSPQSTLVEAETSTRREWGRVLQMGRSLHLTDDIEVASKSSILPIRQNLWEKKTVGKVTSVLF